MVMCIYWKKGAALFVLSVCNGSRNNYTGFPIIYRITVVSHIPIYRMQLLMKPNIRIVLDFTNTMCMRVGRAVGRQSG